MEANIQKVNKTYKLVFVGILFLLLGGCNLLINNVIKLEIISINDTTITSYDATFLVSRAEQTEFVEILKGITWEVECNNRGTESIQMINQVTIHNVLRGNCSLSADNLKTFGVDSSAGNVRFTCTLTLDMSLIYFFLDEGNNKTIYAKLNQYEQYKLLKLFDKYLNNK